MKKAKYMSASAAGREGEGWVVELGVFEICHWSKEPGAIGRSFSLVELVEVFQIRKEKENLVC